MIDETLARIPSPIQQVNPCARVLAAVMLSFSAALSENFILLWVYFILSLVLTAGASIGVAGAARRLKPLFWFVLMLWVVLPVTFEGEAFSRFGPLVLTQPGIELCAKITMKSITILLFFSSLVATMTIASLGNALHKLHVPDKAVFLLLMTYRYIAVIQCEYKRLLRAAHLRGFKSRTSLHSYKTYAYLAGMLFVRASCRAKRVHQAMVCRGFTGRFHTIDLFDSNGVSRVFLGGVSLVTLVLVLGELFWV